MYDFKKYIEEVKKQLYENASEEYRNNHITYGYSDNQIDENVDYFLDCYKKELSPYKSLLFFSDYLKYPKKCTDVVGYDDNNNEYHCFRCCCPDINCFEWRDSITGGRLYANIIKWNYI